MLPSPQAQCKDAQQCFQPAYIDQGAIVYVEASGQVLSPGLWSKAEGHKTCAARNATHHSREEDAERIVQALKHIVVYMADENLRAHCPIPRQKGGDDHVGNSREAQKVLVALRQRDMKRVSVSCQAKSCELLPAG